MAFFICWKRYTIGDNTRIEGFVHIPPLTPIGSVNLSNTFIIMIVDKKNEQNILIMTIFHVERLIVNTTCS